MTGFNTQQLIYSKDNNGATPLDFALRKQRFKAAVILVKATAPITKTRYVESILTNALNIQHNEEFNILRELLANKYRSPKN